MFRAFVVCFCVNFVSFLIALYWFCIHSISVCNLEDIKTNNLCCCKSSTNWFYDIIWIATLVPNVSIELFWNAHFSCHCAFVSIFDWYSVVLYLFWYFCIDLVFIQYPFASKIVCSKTWVGRNIYNFSTATKDKHLPQIYNNKKSVTDWISRVFSPIFRNIVGMHFWYLNLVKIMPNVQFFCQTEIETENDGEMVDMMELWRKWKRGRGDVENLLFCNFQWRADGFPFLMKCVPLLWSQWWRKSDA